MSTVVRNVQDLPVDHRSALERVLGHGLSVDQQVVITVREAGEAIEGNSVGQAGKSTLPGWLNLFEGLSDNEISDLETAILQRNRRERSFE